MPKSLSRASLLLPLFAILAACGRQEPPPEPVRAVRTLVLSADSAGMSHEYAGEIKARTESRLSFRVGGKVLARKVNLGDAVRPGQLLAQLDPQDLILGQEAARAGVLAARANRDQLGADFKRFIELREQGFISAAELERRDNAFKASQAQLDQSKAQANSQGNQSSYAQLQSDVAGVVTGVEAEPGMVVGAGTPIVRIAHDGPRDVVFSVPEDQLGPLQAHAAKPGALTVRLWGAAAGQVGLPAKLREISASADPVTRTFLVKAEVVGLDAKLGQTATVRIEAPRQTQIIKLPLAAVLQQRGQSSVWLLDPAQMTLKAQPVQIAGADGNEVVIAAGLSPGQEVVVAGVHVLQSGQKVLRYQPSPALVKAAPAAPAASR
ncbi:efflux RND transporter periplasmic adaptor subunit [Roseateles oligotrophus]|uniref:Efflux RND transporter periplasmic adaptor subunit n=1 Tax=Roseateles oligotrophus TaxID=1769250 RepID=A0ABT2YAW3_9BURK|nr:efflux RND transporter periplasmic adaptor subunit [Roseateles oligotrophus]MCV2367439.1 efflux RND transporter periplasmic adaptor subunit [Roseateles oligotrophus]